MLASELPKAEYNAYYQSYIGILGDLPFKGALQRGMDEMVLFMRSISSSKLHFAYADSKWTMAEVLLHLIDTERVFQYRALRFARNDKTSLPGFDQDAYVPESGANTRSLESIIEEYTTVRRASISLFTSLDDPAMGNGGKASNSFMSVRAIGFMICGHEKHHKHILESRYLA